MASFDCQYCGMVCKSGAGLASHQRGSKCPGPRGNGSAQTRPPAPQSSGTTEREPPQLHKSKYECQFCGMVCKSGAGLASHQRGSKCPGPRGDGGAQTRPPAPQRSGTTEREPPHLQRSQYECQFCGMVCKSGAGLASHQRGSKCPGPRGDGGAQTSAPPRQILETAERETLCFPATSAAPLERVSISPTQSKYACEACGRDCTTGAGLASHRRGTRCPGKSAGTRDDGLQQQPQAFHPAPRGRDVAVPGQGGALDGRAAGPGREEVASDQVACEECGFFFSKFGIGRHRGSEKCRQNQLQRVQPELREGAARARVVGSDAAAGGDNDQSKLELVVKPTQAGKTFEMIDGIVRDYRDACVSGREDGQTHFVLTMNTKLNNEQCAVRVVGELGKAFGKAFARDNVVIVQSGAKPSVDCRFVTKFEDLFALPRLPLVVLCCSHSVRLDQVYQLLKDLQVNSQVAEEFRGARDQNRLGVFAFARDIKVHHDELHHYVNRNNVKVDGEKQKLAARIKDLDRHPLVTAVHGYTATPGPVLDTWKEGVALRPLRPSNQGMGSYKGAERIRFEIVDTGPGPEHPQEYSERILREHAAEMCADWARVFLPASARAKYHFEMRDAVFAACPHAVVVLLNGKEKTLSWRCPDFGAAEWNWAPGRTTSEDLTKVRGPNGEPREVSEKIADVVLGRRLGNRPLFVTGYLCLGMGQTLMDRRLGNFTHAVLPNRDSMEKAFFSLTPEALYQEAGRVTGRPDLHPTTVFCPEDIRRNFILEETKALRAMEKAADASRSGERRGERGGVTLTKEEFHDVDESRGVTQLPGLNAIVRRIGIGNKLKSMRGTEAASTSASRGNEA